MSAPLDPEHPPPTRRLVAVPGIPAGLAPEWSGREWDDPGTHPPVPARQLHLTPVTQITLRPTHWAWEDRIPHGALTLGPGREGVGKSLFCAWLATHITLGTLPGVHQGTARSVVYAATEDSWERTIAGRLTVAGADLARVYRIDVTHTGTTVPLSLPRDCTALAEQLPTHNVALLILDPLISAIDSRININQEELRSALEPLAALADHTGTAIFGLAHFNKTSGTDALSRITGSRAFAAVARAAIAFARDPHTNDGSCVLSQVKSNLGRLDIPSLRYTIESITHDTPEGPGQWGRLRFLGETTTHVETLLTDTETSQDHTERDAAAGWLTDYLTLNPKSPSEDVKKAARAAGFSVATLHRARASLTVTTTEEGFPRRTFWTLP